jgi:hypothetical protein
MNNMMLVKFDGCLVKEDEKLINATIGYEVHIRDEGKIVSSGKNVTDELKSRLNDVHSEHTEYYALLTALEVARDVSMGLDKRFDLRIQGDSRNVLNCTDERKDDFPTDQSYISIIEDIRDLFDKFDSYPHFQEIDSNSNSTHYNANGARSK